MHRPLFLGELVGLVCPWQSHPCQINTELMGGIVEAETMGWVCLKVVPVVEDACTRPPWIRLADTYGPGRTSLVGFYLHHFPFEKRTGINACCLNYHCQCVSNAHYGPIPTRTLNGTDLPLPVPPPGVLHLVVILHYGVVIVVVRTEDHSFKGVRTCDRESEKQQ